MGQRIATGQFIISSQRVKSGLATGELASADVQELEPMLPTNTSSGECWPMGKVIQQVNDPTRKIGRSKVNYLVEYQDDPECEHVLKLSAYNARKDAGGGAWHVVNNE